MRLSAISQFKGLIGKEIICIPTGNDAKGRDADYYETKVVVSVGRKYVKLKDYFEDEYRVDDGATKSEVNRGYGLNSGYMFFKDVEGFTIYKEHCKLAQEISKKTNYFPWSSLSKEDLLVVKGILFGE